MDAMTPEERFTKIENYLGALTEHQVRHAEEIRELREMHRELTEMQKGMVLAISNVAEAQRTTEAQQQITAQRLDELIKTVDRIIRSQSNN
jgi:archaellum component FlaC